MTTHPDMEMFGTRRRDTLRLPKRRYHIGMALFVLVAAIAIPLLLSERFGKATDAEARGSVQIAQLPVEDRPTPLDASAEELPDLLASIVPLGDNPTEILEAQTAPPVTITSEAEESQAQSRTQGQALVIRPPAPVVPPLDASLTRQTEVGPIPGPNRAGLIPLIAYASERVSTNGQPSVSLIVGGLGINADLTRRAIQELPSAVTLSFAAQSDNLQDWIDQARAFGHEVLLEVPMEGQNSQADAQTLAAGVSPNVNRRRLHQTLAKAQGYIGITHYQGDVFLRRTDAVSPMLTELKSSGLAFFTDGSFEAPSLAPTARNLQVPYRSGFGLIDPVASEKVIEARLNGLSKASQARQGLVGVGFAYPQTIDAVRRWTQGLDDDGLILVPASQTLDR